MEVNNHKLFSASCLLQLSTRDEKTAEFANDEVAHDEPPHLDLHCLLSGL